MSTTTFHIPVTRLPGDFVRVEIDTDRVYDYAKHGIKQVINDRTSGIVRKDFDTEEEWAAEVTRVVVEQATRVSAGIHRLMGERGPRRAPTPKELAAKLGGLDDATLASLGIDPEKLRAALAA